MMKLPVQMKSVITQALKKSYPDTTFQYKTIFIKGLIDESGLEAVEIMKPRYIHLYSDKMTKVTEALFFCEKLLGDAFSYEVHPHYTLPEESTEIDIKLHERSRTLSADDFCNIFNKSTPEESLAYLLKSTILLTVSKFCHKGEPDMYTCELNIRPTIAKITPPDQKRIAFTSPYTAIEVTVNKDEYETLVDSYFDSVAVAHDDKITEFVAPQTVRELLNVAKKIVLGETYKDEFDAI